MTDRITIVRAPHDQENPYFLMRRDTAQDARLSYEARGVLAYLLSKPSDWRVVVSDLERVGCKRDKVYKLLRELREAGYMQRVAVRDQGKYIGMEYHVHEAPFTEIPETVLPDTVFPTLQSKEKKQKKEKKTNTSPSDGRADWQPLLEATKTALLLNDYRVATKYTQFLTGTVPEKDNRGRRNGDWHEYQTLPGMSLVEIQMFGQWLDATYDGEPIRRALTLCEYVGQFRALLPTPDAAPAIPAGVNVANSPYFQKIKDVPAAHPLGLPDTMPDTPAERKALIESAIQQLVETTRL